MAQTDRHGAGGREPGRSELPGHGVRSGATYLYVARVFVAAAGWAGTVVIVRTLSPSDWGRYSFVFGLLGIVGFVVDLQIGRIVLRQVLDAGDEASRIVGSYIFLRLLIGLASFAVAVIVVVVGPYEPSIVWATVVGALGFFFIAPANGFVIWFQSRLWLRPFAIATVAGAVVQLALVLAIASVERGSVVLFAASVAAGEVTILGWRLFALHRRGLGVRLNTDTSRWWAWVKEALPLAIGAALVSIYYRIDIVMLEALDSARSVGQYTIGYKFADIVVFLPEALLTPVTTLLVAAWPRDLASFRQHVRQSIVLLVVAGVAIAAGFALVAAPLIELLYGSEYTTATGSSRLLVAGGVLQFFSYLAYVILVSIGRNRPFAVAGAVGLVINVALNLVLIPAYSFEGSAVATVITEVVVAVLLLAAVRRTPGILSVPWSAILRAGIAGVGMVVAYFGVAAVLPWFVAAVAAGMVFLGLLHVLRVDGPGGLRTLLHNTRYELSAASDGPGVAGGDPTAP